MEFRRTSIKGQKKKHQSRLEGDLVDSGALIFTKTTLDLHTIKKCGGFWRFFIRFVQWFRWMKSQGNPSTITHVDGWDGQTAFGSDLCDPEGGGLNRHQLPIVPQCFSSQSETNSSEDTIEVTTKKKQVRRLKAEELSIGDYEVIQLPESLRYDFLEYQEHFRNDDIKYSLSKAAKSAFTRSKFNQDVQKSSFADGIFCYLGQPFRDHTGGVIQVCCSSFLTRVLMAIEHKQRLEKLIESNQCLLVDKWEHSFNNLRFGFEKLSKLSSDLRFLKNDFDKKWQQYHEQDQHQSSQLLQWCVDYEDRKGCIIRRIRSLSLHISKRIYQMTEEFFEEGYYEALFHHKLDPMVFTFNPECVTPAKLYNFFYKMTKK